MYSRFVQTVDGLLDNSSVIESVLHIGSVRDIALGVPPGELSEHSGSGGNLHGVRHLFGISSSLLLRVGG